MYPPTRRTSSALRPRDTARPDRVLPLRQGRKVGKDKSFSLNRATCSIPKECAKEASRVSLHIRPVGQQDYGTRISSSSTYFASSRERNLGGILLSLTQPRGVSFQLVGTKYHLASPATLFHPKGELMANCCSDRSKEAVRTSPPMARLD